MTLLERGQPAASLAPLKRALKLKPSDPGVLYNLGRAYAGLQEPGKALHHFDQALQAWGPSDPASVPLHTDRGNALLKLGRPREAALAYEQALSLDDSYAPAHLNLASALTALGRPDEALPHLERAAEYDQERVAIYQRIALHHLERRDLDGAYRYLQAARALDGTNPDTFLLLSRLHRARGEGAQARQAQAQACKLGRASACE
jgi:tetratricopeptide (TPR) repeat protein